MEREKLSRYTTIAGMSAGMYGRMSQEIRLRFLPLQMNHCLTHLFITNLISFQTSLPPYEDILVKKGAVDHTRCAASQPHK